MRVGVDWSEQQASRGSSEVTRGNLLSAATRWREALSAEAGLCPGPSAQKRLQQKRRSALILTWLLGDLLAESGRDEIYHLRCLKKNKKQNECIKIRVALVSLC